MVRTNRDITVLLRLLVPVLLPFFLLFNSTGFADEVNEVEIFYFYESGCASCEKLEDFFEQRLKPNYPVVISRYEIHTSDNANLLLGLAEAYNAKDIIEEGAPAVFIGDKAFHGASQKTLRGIEEAVRAAAGSGAPSALSGPAKEQKSVRKQLTISAVIGASAVDAINPCAFGVLTLLLSTMLIFSRSSTRRRVINAGFAFTAATYICYLLMGFGLFTAIQVAGLQHYIYIGVSVLAIVVGLWNTKDFFWYERGINIEVPQSWQPRLKQITRSVTSVPSAFIIGCLVSVLLLPCTSGPYVVIIGMLSDTATRMQAVRLLLLYNLIFVLPFIIITLGVGFGLTSPARIEQMRQKWLKRLHLATGIFMLALGATMITLLIIGII